MRGSGLETLPAEPATPDDQPDEVDVLVLGAGLSGVGAACRLRQRCPELSVAVLEARTAIGGTWDVFRYPGVRSDSDMYTLGYPFRPWTGPAPIADGASILAYIRRTAAEYGVDRLVRYGRRAVRADWSSVDARWRVEVRTDTGETTTVRCRFLFACTGYYRYDSGYAPAFPGIADFGGQVVHPQQWPADLDCTNARVVVIGSGATAVTLLPALAGTAAHVTMLQRSPSYVLSLPSRDPLADLARRALPPGAAYQAVRWKNVLLATGLYQLSRRRPAQVGRWMRSAVARQLPADVPVDPHFTPRYDPWDQRLCIAPGGDFFAALRSGRASVVTGTIARFTVGGVLLDSGQELPADVVVSATGLQLQPIGGMALTVDGAPVRLADTVAYKGVLLSGVPNFALALGYTNASWTLKCDLTSEYVCRLLRYLLASGYDEVTPTVPDGPLPTRPLLDLSAGYIRRSLHDLPRQGRSGPWRMRQNYLRDYWTLRHGRLVDPALRFRTAAQSAPAGPGD